MKTAIVFYSYSGSTKKFCTELANKIDSALFEILDKKRPSIIGAFLRGCPAAITQKSAALNAPIPALSQYDKIIIAAPVWAGFPAPMFNSIVDALPERKEIEIYLLSGSAKTEKCREKVIAKVNRHSPISLLINDIKGA